MKKIYLISAAMLFPAALFADVNVQLSIGTHDDCEYADEVEYTDDGEPWFEECEANGSAKLSFEYQWSLHGSNHVLRYRQVTFHTIDNAWAFGPWMVKVNYCHPSCRLHHSHVYYHHASHHNWHRAYDHHRKIYVYEYRHPNQRFGHAKVYRHEYRPNHNHYSHNQHHYNNHDSHNNNRHYDKPHHNNGHQSNYNEHNSGKLYKSAAPVNHSGRKPHDGGNHQYNSREIKGHSSNGKIVRISGR